MEIINEKYKIENTILGSGGFSQVFLGTDITTNQPVAIKKVILSQKSLKNDIGLKNLKSEIELMRTFDHPNIVKYYDLVKTSNIWYIIMEYCNMGTVQDVINFNESMSKKKSLNFNREANTYYYLNQLKSALDYLRKVECIHRDIKPMNILLTRQDIDLSLTDSGTIFKSDEQLANSFDKSNLDQEIHKEKIIVKLADFGLARSYIDSEELLMKTICGSPLYMAPEVILVKEYDSKADLWSFGIIMYELLFGTHPQSASSMSQLINNLKSQNIDFQLHKNFTPECFDLLKKLLNKNPEQRISWSEFLNHKWFYYWKNINLDSDDKIFVKNASAELNKLDLMNNFEPINPFFKNYRDENKKSVVSLIPIIITEHKNQTVHKNLSNAKLTNNLSNPKLTNNLPNAKLTNNSSNPKLTNNLSSGRLTNNLSNPRLTSNLSNLKSPSEPIKISNQSKFLHDPENHSPKFYSQIGSPISPESSFGKSNLSRMKMDNYCKSYVQGTYAEHCASYPPIDSGKISKSVTSDNKIGIPIQRRTSNNTYERSNSYGASSSLGRNTTSRSRIFQNFDSIKKDSIINDNSDQNLLEISDNESTEPKTIENFIGTLTDNKLDMSDFVITNHEQESLLSNNSTRQSKTDINNIFSISSDKWF
jgi:serine/threonine protein kinase